MQKRGDHNCRLMRLILALLGVMIGLALPDFFWRPRVSAQGAIPLAPNPSWVTTGNLNQARDGHTATLLPNGKVLVAGGYTRSAQSYSIIDSAEVYDPATGTWSATGKLNLPRYVHTATLLPNGKVLVAGGNTSFRPPSFGITDSAEVYDPATGTWSLTGALKTTTNSHTATLLPNGKVLITGGWGGSAAHSDAELYDPNTGTWSLTGSLKAGRYGPTATLLENGKVLVAGGSDDGDLASTLASAELYDPATGTWSSADSLNAAPIFHTATLLPGGKVLVTGGYNWPPFTLNSAELYDPANGKWDFTSSLNAARDIHTATLLPNGGVLVAGGYNWNSRSFANSSELYDLGAGKWSSIANLNTGRSGHTATLLLNGKVLVAGGGGDNGVLSSAELFDPGMPQPGTIASVSAAGFNLMRLASESLIASFGEGLATTTVSADTRPLPTQLAGTTVKVKDSAGVERLAPLFFVSPRQVNYQIPPGTAAGAASVTITSGNGAVSTGVALINAVAPSLFTANGNGQGVAAAFALRVKADGSQSYEPIAEFNGGEFEFVTRPIDLGPEGEHVYLVLFGTGIRHRSSLSSVIATIGGAPAEVSFAGAQGDFIGLDQTNVLVPRNLAGRGEVDVLLTVEAQMANPVRVNIK